MSAQRTLSESAVACRIALVEDQPILRAGLRQATACMSAWKVVWEADSMAAARGHLRTSGAEVDVLILDIGLPDGSGLDLLAEIDQGIRVLMYSVLGDEQNVVRALENGAAGYLLKEARPADVVEAISSVLNGGAPLTPSVAAHLLKRLKKTEPDRINTLSKSPALQTLTPRESEVLLALARGYSYDETAALLTISPHTVGHHVKQIYSKLAVNSKSAAVFEAVQAGWL
jgi:DNA-binding NarL/FixJ family response regulator